GGGGGAGLSKKKPGFWAAPPACLDRSLREGDINSVVKGTGLMKVKPFVDAARLKKAVNHLPQGAAEEGVRFRALVGEKKGEKLNCGGIYIGPPMLPDFEKERKNFKSVTQMDGWIRKSSIEPDRRLVLITKTSAGALKDVVRASLKEAKLRYTLVVLKPGEAEPQHVPEDTDDDLEPTDTAPRLELKEEIRDRLSAKL